MCGRYDLHQLPGALALAVGVAYPHAFVPRYNIAPGQDVDAVRVHPGGEHEWARVRWGLVPRWARDPSIGARMVNARAEGVADSKAFATPWRKHRCLVPADGFYVWHTLANGRKQPMRATLRDGRTFALAGIAERWLSPDGQVVDSCAIITTTANALLRSVQPRMPAIIAAPDYARWLDHVSEPPLDLLTAYPALAMALYPVSLRVNATRNDDAGLIAPLEDIEPHAVAAASPGITADEAQPELALDEPAPEQPRLF